MSKEQLAEPKYERLQERGIGSPFAELLGFEPIEHEPGRVLLKLPFSQKLLQSLGRVHGGAIFSLADHASGWAAYSTLNDNERCATLEMKINYIAALHDEDCLADARYPSWSNQYRDRNRHQNLARTFGRQNAGDIYCFDDLTQRIEQASLFTDRTKSLIFFHRLV